MGKLPDYAKLKELYGTGWTYAELAQNFEVSKSWLYLSMRREAEARGEWPLADEETRRERIRQTRAGTCHMELLDSSTIVLALQMRIAEYPGSCAQFCRHHDLRPTTIGELLQ